MWPSFRYGVGTLTAVLVLSAAGTAFAQSVSPMDQTVTTRPRPELDPLGMRMGSFFLFPSLGVGETYDDNIYLTDSGKIDDYITDVTPSLQLVSNWGRDALNFGASADIGRYASHSSENFNDYNLSGGGRLDISRRSSLSAGLTYSKLHESRGSPDAANGINPTTYRLAAVNTAFKQQFNRVHVTLSGTTSNYSYNNVVKAGGSIAKEDLRDRNEYEGSIRVGYDIVPHYQAFVKTTYYKRTYVSAKDTNGYNRDSHGYGAVSGVRLDLSGKTFGDVFIGYRQEDYKDANLPTIGGLDFGAALTWNATSLTTAKLGVTRSVEESTLSAASGYFQTAYRLSVDHELLRNMLIGGNLSYTTDDYKGINRTDKLPGLGLYARYMMNRNLYLSAGYNYSQRSSDAANSDYKDNQFVIKLQTQL